MKKIVLALVVFVLFSSVTYAYNDISLELLSNEMNKTLPKPHDKYTTWESTSYLQGVTTYIYKSDYKISDFSSDDLYYIKNGYKQVLLNRVCAHLNMVIKKDSRVISIFKGASNRFLTFDSEGKVLNDVEIKVNDCLK